MSEKNISKSQFSGFLGNRVLDFNASKMVKARTGVTKSIPFSTMPDSPEMIKHENEAMALANPPVQKKSMLEKFGRAIGVWED